MKLRTRTNQPVYGDEIENLQVTGDLKAFENIVDKDGHKRFIEGDLEEIEHEGVTFNYAKWSLSGSHLMIVIACSLANGTAVTSSWGVGNVTLPQWVYDKIYPVFAGSLIDMRGVNAYGNDWSNQSVQIKCAKASNNKLYFEFGAVTITKDRGFRYQLDLLIDNE